VVLTVLGSFLRQSCLVCTSVTSALEVLFNAMHYINLHVTYLLTYLLMSIFVDPSQNVQQTLSEKDGGRTSGSSGHQRSQSSVSKVSSGYLSMPHTHSRQSSADSAAIFHHHR